MDLHRSGNRPALWRFVCGKTREGAGQARVVTPAVGPDGYNDLSALAVSLTLIIQVSHRSTHGTPVQPEYWEETQRSPAGCLHSGSGLGMPIAVLPGQGVKLVYSTHPPNPHP